MSDVIDWTTRWSSGWVIMSPSRRMFPARLIALTIIVVAVATGPLRFAWYGRGLAAAILIGVCVAAWIVWSAGIHLIPERIGEPAVIVAVATFGLAGSVLTGLDLPSTAVIFPTAAVLSSVVRFKALPALAGTVACSLAMMITAWLLHANTGTGFGYVGLLFGLYGIGLGRRAQKLRSEATERLLVETRRANTEEANAAALAERGRIAREIHDVLAHSLSALTVQLEAADALLSGGIDPVKAHGYVVKARHIAREGLTETRRAIAALREDTPPLRAMLRSLAESYESDIGAPAAVIADCDPTGLLPDATLALYRTAQESLTNARKHAPGAPIEIALTCTESVAELTVTNQAATAPTTALASSGGGYGLSGLKERAELAGGTFEAGPYQDGWRVRLRIPFIPTHS